MRLRMKYVRDNPSGLSFTVTKKGKELSLPRSLANRRLINRAAGWVEFDLPEWKVKEAGLEAYEVD